MMPFTIVNIKTKKEYTVLQIYFSRKAFESMAVLKNQTNTITEMTITEMSLDRLMKDYEFIEFIK